MKPTNKKNVQDENRKDKSAKKIDNYFRSAPKPFIVDKIDDPKTTKSFYVQALNKKLEKIVVDKGSTANIALENDGEDSAKALVANRAVEIDEEDGARGLALEDENKDSDKPHECAGCVEKENQSKYWETKYKDLKRVYMIQSHHFSELNIKHNVLLTIKPNSCQPGDKDGNAMSTCNDDVFSPYELKILQNMSLDKKKDSTFIHQCLEYAYKSDLSVLSHKTLKGKPESTKFSEEGREINIPKKYPLSPEKVDRIKELFVERINKCNIDSASFDARIKDSNINKLFASSITNIANKNI